MVHSTSTVTTVATGASIGTMGTDPLTFVLSVLAKAYAIGRAIDYVINKIKS